MSARSVRNALRRLSILKKEWFTTSVPRLTLEGARLVMATAARKAVELGVPMDIAVVDEGGHLLVFNRMNGAKLSSIDIAISKAWTAACARRATHEYAAIAGPGRPAYGIHMSNNGRFTIVGGGVPISINGHVLGGIGCSSGTVQQDRDVAQAGIAALSSRPRTARARPVRPQGRSRGTPRKRVKSVKRKSGRRTKSG